VACDRELEIGAYRVGMQRGWTGERVVDVGSGAGFDSFVAAGQVGRSGALVWEST
jgi:16S rRNA G527 N7-methylase RsmG